LFINSLDIKSLALKRPDYVFKQRMLGYSLPMALAVCSFKALSFA